MIGIFDSGLGGLTILKSLLRELPSYDYIYLGDIARVPYGSRSFDTIYLYTLEAVDFLFEKGCKLIILACNTASAAALRKIQQEYLPLNYPDRRVLGVLIPAAEEAAKITKNGKVGVIGTEATVKSETLKYELIKQNSNLKVYQSACPLLVPIIEAGEMRWVGLDLILKKYLKPLKEKNVDTLVLGCTHYSVIKKEIAKVMGSKVKIVSEDDIIGFKLKNYLLRHPEMEKKLSKKRKRYYFTTSYSQNFNEIAKIFLKMEADFKIVKL